MSLVLGQGDGANTSVSVPQITQPIIDPVQSSSVASATVVSPMAAALAAQGAGVASTNTPIGVLEPTEDPWKNFILVGLLIYVIWLKTRG